MLIAPHHGRKSDRDYRFLDVLRPKLTLFGNASSDHLTYDAWSRRNLPIITNNQAGSVIADMGNGQVYVTNESFARRENQRTFVSPEYRGYFLKTIMSSADARNAV